MGKCCEKMVVWGLFCVDVLVLLFKKIFQFVDF